MEIKKMYMTQGLDKEGRNIKPVMAFINENGYVDYWKFEDDRDMHTRRLSENFFPSKEEAVKFNIERTAFLIKNQDFVRNILKEVRSYEDDGHYEKHWWRGWEFDGFIPENVRAYFNEKEVEYDIVEILALCARSGLIKLAGVTVPIRNIDYLEWKSDSVDVHTKGGNTIVVDDGNSMELLDMIFDAKYYN